MSSPSPSTAHRRRVPFWDNARFAAVTLVVIGHGIQRLTYESDNALTAYLFIYAFHMPAFAMISGYFSKATPPGSRQMKKVLTDILLPYFVMEAIWTLVQFLVEGKREFNPTNPSWTLWFLLALGIFRLILPYLAIVRWPLLFAIITSVSVGYFDNVDSTFSLSRAIGILPFFVLGWKMRTWGLVDRWRAAERVTWWVRGLSIVVLGGWLAVVASNIRLFREIDLRFWFFYDDSYRGLGEDQWWAGLVRLGLIALAVLLSAAFFALIPRSATWYTTFGQATMYVYLLHSFVLYPIRETGVLADEHSSALWLVSMILAGIAISIALSSPLVRRVFRPLVEPKPRWLFREVDDAPAAPGGPSRTDPTGSRRDRDQPRQ
ncbi:acyltransferase family protein [Leifsonia sp. H3M29-4]|uniref:acyltransferase family protein n=1 Tax=Salinibacterium metalliresistens TaxID=3031321 RepID=UPI0023DB5E17|nr:acyltransferase family protein [Salinibacterium metalliresistens]MDF1479677.1 acyltransferase family protein [Salinibacterium metalliresistens]